MCRLDSLTGLRALAAAAVFTMHALYALSPTVTASVPRGPAHVVSLVTAGLGCASVSLFFVLSGFVLTWSARATDTARAVWRRRYWRIFPNHLVVLALALTWTATRGASGGSPLTEFNAPPSPGPALSQTLLVHVWVPRVGYIMAGNGVTWSLACEAFFYLCFPVLHRLVRAIPRDRLWGWASGVSALGLAVPCIALLAPAGPPVEPGTPVSLGQYWLAYVLPPSRLPEFVLGMLVARLVAERSWPPLRRRHAGCFLLFAVAAVSTGLPPVFTFAGTYAVPCALLVASLAAGDTAGKRSWLRTRAAVLAGDRSFAFYVVHYLVIAVALRVVFEDRNRLGGVTSACAFLLFLVLSAAAAHLLHRYVESPLVRRHGRSGKTATRGPAGHDNPAGGRDRIPRQETLPQSRKSREENL